MWDLDPTGLTCEYIQLGSCHGPAGGAPAAGAGGGVPAERLPRDTPPNMARRGEIVTKTQELRPALSCEPLPNHVLPLAHFGAIYDVCDGGVVRNDHHNAGERSGSTQHSALRPGGSPCICWWLVKPITGQAPSTSTAATLE
jgi:hypothetical protein